MILLCWLLIQTETVQNFLIGKVTARLSKDLHTEIKIKHVSLSLFNRVDLEGTLVRDQQKDTLLYAGKLKVRITDWFFWKDKADLKYIGLEDALIKQNRHDSVWNYQFIADYFASSDTTPKKPKQKGIQLNLKKIDLKNVYYFKKDEWIGENMHVKVGSMLLDADNIDFDKSIFQVNEIQLDKPVFTIEDYDGLRPPRVKKKNVKDTGMYFNAADIFVQVGLLKITNGTFGTGDLHPTSDPGLFDGSNIQVNKINGTVKGYVFSKDTMRANIELTAHERCGLEVKKLKAHFRFTPQIMEFSKLDLHTNRSQLRNYYAMKYKDFNKDMSDYINKVDMEAHFNSSEVSSDDVAFFAPELRTWKKQVAMSGRFNGTVENFSVKNMFLRSGGATYVSGELAMKGLPDIDKTNISLTNANVQTNYAELTAIVPMLKGITDPNLQALGNIQYKGTFNGSIYNFVTNGNISSALGGMYSNIAMTFPEKGSPTYNGTLVTKQFELGKFLNVDGLGKVSFNGKITGSSFQLDKAKTSLNGSFDQLTFNDYNYTNIVFNGTIQKKNFHGELKTNDPNFDFTSSIEIDLNDSVPKFNVLGDLAKSNLQNLKLTPNQKIQLSGLFDLNFHGKNIDEFLGSAKLLNATLIHDTTRLSFDSLSLNAYIDTANRNVLSIQSNEFDILLRGQYNLLDLPNSFQLFLNKYFPSYVKAPYKMPKNQRFLLTLKTRTFDRYARLLDPQLSGLNNAVIVGGINTKDSGTFYVRTNIPSFKYDRYRFENAVLQGRGDSIKVNLTGEVGKAYIGDSLYFPNTKLNIISQKDHSVVHVATSANTTLNDAQLNADVYTLEDGVRINFQPSDFVVNDKKWNLEKEGEIIIRRNFASAQNVHFTQGFQTMDIETEEIEGANGSDLVVKLKDVNIGDFTPLITHKPSLEGIANGNVYLRDFFDRFKMDADIKLSQFRLDNDSVGLVNIRSDYTKDDGKINFEVQSDNATYRLNGKGSYNLKDSVAPLVINTQLKGTKITILNELLDGLFSEITGQAEGELSIKGNPNSPDLVGRVKLHNGGLKVNYTQVYYTIDSATFDFKEGVIDFGRFTIKDKLKNTGEVRGKLYQHGFKNMRYDFDMSTNKLLVLDTKAKDNNMFYGRAIGKASLSLKGPQENMRMYITGEVNDTTQISIPTSNANKETADADFIVWKKYGTEMKQEKKETDTKLSIDLDLAANRMAAINVILDDQTGEVIRARGAGRMSISIPATGNMTMKGRYNIERGSYNFNFQSIIRKPFTLDEGDGNYIEWTGDPYNANLSVDAKYTAENVALNDLIGNQSFNLGSNSGSLRGYRGEVYVIAQLRGRLSKPDIGFKIQFPQNSVAKNDNDLALFLNRIENDDNEMLKQVTYLIVFDAFAPYGDARTGNTLASSISSSTLNTVSQLITSEFNKLVTGFLYKVTGDKSLRLDVGTSTYSTASLIGAQQAGGNRLDRQNVNLKLSQSLLNNKLIITFGGDLDFNLGNNQVVNGNFQWLPDVSVQYVLSKDRKLRGVIFNKSSLDVGTGANAAGIGRRNRQGVSISYTRDFERLFGNKPKKQPTPEPPAPPKNSAAQADSTAKP
ncbi:translocation/assembly module TamB domain-containing protein [Deminuibacter soli]|uniref:Translocation and assembly module TamB C-terminal domain-containing protein n=1 Tax=Deminuibacter soli TaxID=2291815 RepID=A0A3E1NCS6_9BACT|nr:translocation/assembly module TamB domain-containing protein [Deminuibacter soli]RFM25568.1 hypothetical protein DXN05_24325 [Deminuibacter soli]